MVSILIKHSSKGDITSLHKGSFNFTSFIQVFTFILSILAFLYFLNLIAAPIRTSPMGFGTTVHGLPGKAFQKLFFSIPWQFYPFLCIRLYVPGGTWAKGPRPFHHLLFWLSFGTIGLRNRKLCFSLSYMPCIVPNSSKLGYIQQFKNKLANKQKQTCWGRSVLGTSRDSHGSNNSWEWWCIVITVLTPSTCSLFIPFPINA